MPRSHYSQPLVDALHWAQSRLLCTSPCKSLTLLPEPRRKRHHRYFPHLHRSAVVAFLYKSFLPSMSFHHIFRSASRTIQKLNHHRNIPTLWMSKGKLRTRSSCILVKYLAVTWKKLEVHAASHVSIRTSLLALDIGSSRSTIRRIFQDHLFRD